ncbi:hypothetical protein PLANPX_5698 [Lacipirellula parvula]|uniref:Uncharacterized protein n=1 Tax=Lacipirellula parvula TaxID=2650471 RepID=A0A5K7XML4_9BACT|nr:hypothetical protein PLANPX_5698 [Lacipirellula parvula]
MLATGLQMHDPTSPIGAKTAKTSSPTPLSVAVAAANWKLPAAVR